MNEIKYEQLAAFLRTGREIEFVLNEKLYSITNNPTGYWYLCVDTEDTCVVIEKVCPYKELEYLAERIGDIVIEDVSIRQVFDELLYDPMRIDIL